MTFARSRTTAGIPCNDTYDLEPGELWLIRAGQHVFTLWRAESRGKTARLAESGPLWEALQTIWQLKVEYRREAAERRKAAGMAFAERLRGTRQ